MAAYIGALIALFCYGADVITNTEDEALIYFNLFLKDSEGKQL